MTPNSAGKEETVAERAVRGYFAGYIHGTREIDSTFFQVNERPKLDGTGDWKRGLYATVSVFIPQKSLMEMLRRERAAVRRKKVARIERQNPGGYIGEALASIGEQKPKRKKKR